jgi:hypothetical protein
MAFILRSLLFFFFRQCPPHPPPPVSALLNSHPAHLSGGCKFREDNARIWRRGWDLNPRARFYQATRFRGGLFQPLRHLSGARHLSLANVHRAHNLTLAQQNTKEGDGNGTRKYAAGKLSIARQTHMRLKATTYRLLARTGARRSAGRSSGPGAGITQAV